MQTLIALHNPLGLDLTDWPNYCGSHGGLGFEKAMTMEPREIIDLVVASGLRGRGGAGFSTGLKERFTGDAFPSQTDRYLVCNADEGEPGTFKDRIIMEQAPFRLLEGMLIAARAVGARRGYLYIRGEYTRAITIMGQALQTLRDAGWLGRPLQEGLEPFDIELRRGAGSYLCGEELTLIESIEGKRGHPRHKPPFPAESGLFGRPTLVNNVETFAHLPAILMNGTDWYRSMGTRESPGTKIFCLSGEVRNPGWIEAPMGLKLRDLLFGFGQGPRQGSGFCGVLLGGAAGTFAGPEAFDLPLAYETLKAEGLVLGSGAVIAISSPTSRLRLLRDIIAFFAHESCGKCVPCRIGCRQLLIKLDLILSENRGLEEADWAAMVEWARLMAGTSLCPLGQSPILPIESYGRAFHPHWRAP